MQFNSLTFLIFFSLVLAVYYSLSSWKARKVSLLAASYLFYMAWNPPFVLLVWISTIADWLLAKRIANAASLSSKRFYLLGSLGVNLGLLGFFKYGEFLLGNFIALAKQLGVNYSPPNWEIILPVGISFYTFQTLSYTIDVYWGRLKPNYSFLDFALFVTFFPQLVAGPIVRASYFLPQCLKKIKVSFDQISWGLSLISIGLFAKIVLADSVMAPVVDTVYKNPSAAGTFEAWSAVFAFSGQIFFDFSGYSTCAIGAALCLGFVLPDNFRAPYAAVGFSDFWRRWHISLSSWLRDYLYIPLGGNRMGSIRTAVNLMLTMLIGGLWHGASWLFILWGCLHGFYLLLERVARQIFSHIDIPDSNLFRLFMGIATFILVSITWVFFRSPDFDTAVTILGAMFTEKNSQAFLKESALMAFWVTIMLLAWHWFTRHKSLEDFFHKFPWWLRAGVLGPVILITIFSTGDNSAFIYFQF